MPTHSKGPAMPGEDPNDIIESSFALEQEVTIAAPRAQVWEALLRDTDAWWSHRVRKDGTSRILIEPRIGGRFYESFGGGPGEPGARAEEGALWGTVTRYEPPSLIRFSGPLGMDLPVTSIYTFHLEEAGGHTTLRLTHRAIGQLRRGWADAHDRGWRQLWDNLKRLVEERRDWRQ